MTVIRNNTSRLVNKSDASDDKIKASLKQWIETHKTMLDIFVDAYCIVDNSNNVVDFNVAFTELTGCSFRKVHKIAAFCELLKTQLCPHQCPSKQITSSHKPLRLDELTAVSSDQRELTVILSGVPIVDAGQNLGALLTIRNVSAESELQKKYDDRKRESITDGLTRLYNKTHTEQLLLRSLKVTLRSNQPLSFLIADVDYFKKINDNHGHQAGDYILSTVATELKLLCRETDMVGRFGGEEFVAILPSTPLAGASIFAEKLRSAIESHAFIYDGKRIPVTISLGTATFHTPWHPGLNPERSMKELINQADTALYFAKANGRNQARQFEMLPANNKAG